MAGFVGLGIELAAERLLAPAFGTTIYLWSIIIALTFSALSIGYEIGGKIIDRHPSHRLMSIALILAGLWTVGVAFLGRSFAFWVQGWTFDFGGITFGVFVSALVLLTIQPLLLGFVTPAAIRLTTTGVGEAGSSAGRIFGYSTIGSLLGTFLPVLVLMPFLGVRLTFTLVGLSGIVAGLPGLTSFVHGPVATTEASSIESESERDPVAVGDPLD